MKVQVRTTCSFCDGEAYLPVPETVSCTGEQYIQHLDCTPEQKQEIVMKLSSQYSISRICQVLDYARSSCYYQPVE